MRVYKNRMLIRILDTRDSDWGGVGDVQDNCMLRNL